MNFPNQMRPLGQMWNQRIPQMPQMGQLPTMGQQHPMNTGIVPPNMQSFNPQQPTGQFPMNPQQAPQMGQLPPMQSPMQQPQMHTMQQPQQQNPMMGFHQQVQDWRQQRPDFRGMARPDDFRQQMMDWRGLRPDRPQF